MPRMCLSAVGAAPLEERGDEPTPGRQHAAALRAEAHWAQRCRRSAVPALAGSRYRLQRALGDRVSASWRAVVLTPVVLIAVKVTGRGWNAALCPGAPPASRAPEEPF
jgi:hypothetical protein